MFNYIFFFKSALEAESASADYFPELLTVLPPWSLSPFSLP